MTGGDRVSAPVVVSNADPRVTLRLLENSADTAWAARVQAIPQHGSTMKVSVALHELPNFAARSGTLQPHHFGQINTPLTKMEWETAFAAAERGEVADHLWTELYFQSVHDASVAPEGMHVMSVFAQYVPYQLRHGDSGDAAC